MPFPHRAALLIPLVAAAVAADPVYLTAFRDPTAGVEAHRLAAAQAPVEPLTWQGGGKSGSEQPTVIPIPGTAFVLHRAAITGLAPGSALRLRFGAEPELATRTVPLPADRPLRIATGGDTMHEAKWFAATTKAMMARDPDLTVLGGDLAYEDGKKGARVVLWMRTWAEHARTADGRIQAFVSCIGNHEVDGHYGGTPAKAPFYFAMLPIAGRAYHAVDIGPDLSFILLDTDHATRIPGEQTDWLTKALTDRAKRRTVIPVYHYPAYPTVKAKTGGHPFDDRVAQLVRQHWLPLFEQQGVRLALEHDQHCAKRTVALKGGVPDATGITYLGDGAWGVKVRKPRQDLAGMAMAKDVRHGWLLEIHPDQRIAVTAIDEDGAVFDQVAIPTR